RPQLAELADMVDVIELDPSFAETGGGAQLLEVRGRLALARNDRERGLADLRASGATFAALGVGPTWSQWRSLLALALPPDEGDHAKRLVDEEMEMARGMGRPELGGPALRAAGLLAGGERGIELLRDSVSVLEASRLRLEHARSSVELGAALRRCKRRSEAREHLATGMELAHHCGAERLQARANEELHAAGARPRRVDRSGAGSLTASELRVARLAAEGHSNLDIAQALYVSTKT